MIKKLMQKWKPKKFNMEKHSPMQINHHWAFVAVGEVFGFEKRNFFHDWNPKLDDYLRKHSIRNWEDWKTIKDFANRLDQSTTRIMWNICFKCWKNPIFFNEQNIWDDYTKIDAGSWSPAQNVNLTEYVAKQTINERLWEIMLWGIERGIKR